MLRFCSVNFLHSLGCLNPFGQTTSHIFVLVSAVSAVWTAGQSVLLDVIMVDKTWSCFSVGSVEEKGHSALMGSNIAWPTCMSGDIKMWRKKGRFSGSICKPPLNWDAEIVRLMQENDRSHARRERGGWKYWNSCSKNRSVGRFVRAFLYISE